MTGLALANSGDLVGASLPLGLAIPVPQLPKNPPSLDVLPQSRVKLSEVEICRNEFSVSDFDTEQKKQTLMADLSRDFLSQWGVS